jgi:hypothetical protein
MTLASLSLIQGLSFGLEYVDAIPEDDIPNSIVLDVLFLRFIFAV